MKTTEKNSEPQNKTAMDRRSILTSTAVAAATLLAGGLFTPHQANAVTPPLTFSDIPGSGDVQVLNFALALEDLEADLYTQALQRFTVGGKNALGIEIPGMNLNFGDIDVYYTHQYGIVEARHRDFLRTALGSAAIPSYKYDFGMQSLSRKEAVTLIHTAEALGTAAYLGAIPYLTTATYLQIAGGIQGTEARHTAVFAEILDSLYGEDLDTGPVTKQYGGMNVALEIPIDPNTVLKTVSPYIVT